MVAKTVKNKYIKTLDKGLYSNKYRNKRWGTYCVFVPLNKKWGIKVYDNKQNRDCAYKKQLKAYKNDIGPFCHSKFKYDDKFCFVTSRVNRVFDDLPEELWEKNETKVWEVCSNLRKIKLADIAVDVHPGNFGLIGRRVVCVDFS